MTALAILSLYGSSAATQQCTPRSLLPAYAHNDYLNPHPLQDALALGYQGVEADYVLVEGELLVAHGRADAMRGRTLEGLYLAPLRERVRRCGWVQSPIRPFLLTIEYKERGLQGYQALHELLKRYADILSPQRAPGAVQVVLVGWHPSLRELAADCIQLARVQARITRSGVTVPEGDTALVGLVSLDYGKTMEWKGSGALSSEDRRTLEYITAGRHLLPGRLVRAYDVPLIPEVYTLLLSSGVDREQETRGSCRDDPDFKDRCWAEPVGSAPSLRSG
jgi:hypothetical protein